MMDCCQHGSELIHVMPNAWNMNNIKMIVNLVRHFMPSSMELVPCSAACTLELLHYMSLISCNSLIQYNYFNQAPR